MNRRQFLKISAAATATVAIAATDSGSRLDVASLAAQSNAYRAVKCPILMYHYVSPLPENADQYRRDLTVTPERFREHCAYLAENGYTTVTMHQLYQALFDGVPLPENPVVLTFDDGYAGMAVYAVPIMQAYGHVGTFFVVQNFMGASGYLTWEQAAGMLGAGMEIENHSATHANLRNRSDEILMQEIEGSAQVFEQVLGRRSRFFCYPFGHYDNNVIRVLRETGHLMAVTTSDGTMQYWSDPYRLRRCRIRNSTSVYSLGWLIGRYV